MSVLRRIGAIERELDGAASYESYLARLTDRELMIHIWANMRELSELVPRDQWKFLPDFDPELFASVVIPREEKRHDNQETT